MNRLLTFLVLAVSLNGFAASNPPMPDTEKARGTLLPSVTLTRDNGTSFALSDLKGKPLILNPIFVSCPHTCSPITRSLLKATEALKAKGYDFRVLTFSFDPADSVESMKQVRNRIGLPEGWEVAWGTPEEIGKLLNALDYHVQPSAEAGFLHPNLVAVANADLKLQKYVFGVELHADELELALIESRRTTPWWNPLWKSMLVLCAVAAGVGIFIYYGKRV